ncbi:MAG: tRNA (adenosine(37)-N6)-threonylcarbamoyltransferase complex ATPase subunit type 1 TsaE [Dysgonamonadaceae bacterium]|jgi:tRNA threonylcarbamoyladenosine biosynthesis protein TsaE|nr:tRNA (adenosine(37)-N6)-threonylcarbamoyltransferase complex ATPase subunit type 1 TsaE [Dysgonamonadaceae bacterium]
MLVENLKEITTAAREFVARIDNKNVFAFKGKMGAGKTTFIKAVCKELGVQDEVNSPTFAIVNEYFSQTRRQPVYHFDFYRIENNKEAINIGLHEYLDSGFLCLIEWADKIEDLLPENTAFVEIIELPKGKRQIIIS